MLPTALSALILLNNRPTFQANRPRMPMSFVRHGYSKWQPFRHKGVPRLAAMNLRFRGNDGASNATPSGADAKSGHPA
jgi:hypothetical protein